jgi:hypothetical protein
VTGKIMGSAGLRHGYRDAAAWTRQAAIARDSLVSRQFLLVTV